MRLLIVTTMAMYPWGGSEELWYQTALAALDAGHTVGVVAFKWPKRARQLQSLADRGVWLFERRLERTGRLATLINKFFDPFRGVEAFKTDVLYINQSGSYDLTGNSEAFRLCELIDRLSVRYSIVCQCSNELDVPRMENCLILRRRFAAADWVGFVADAMIHTTERQLACTLPNARVVRNPVNLSDLTPLPWPAGSTARLAVVGRLEPRKGLDLLLEALSTREWRERDWSLDVFGDGPHRPYYQELIGHLNLKDRVTLAGHEKDIRKIWSEHQLLLLTSHYEGTPLAIVEALLLGRPALATDVGGAREWVIDGQTGFLAAAPNVQSISEALERCWSQRDRWEQMGAAARSLAMKQYDPHAGQTILRMLVDPKNFEKQANG